MSKREKAKDIYDEIHPDHTGMYGGGSGASGNWGKPDQNSTAKEKDNFPKSDETKKIEKLNKEADEYHKKYVVAAAAEEILGNLTVEGLAKGQAKDFVQGIVEDV